MSFESLGVPSALCDLLVARGIEAPFPIQQATLPDALAGRDVCGRAPTGAGKTLAFGLTIAARLQPVPGKKARRARPGRPLALVLVPTRELASQVSEEIGLLLGRRDDVLAVYGGTGYGPTRRSLQRGVPVVVACPGRLEDLLSTGDIHLGDVELAVLDEADRMADMGFLPAVKRILDGARDDRQTLLFSATLDGAVDTLVKRYQHKPARHDVGGEDKVGAGVDHRFWQVERSERVQHTAALITRHGSTIVFSRTRHGADRLTKQLARVGVSSAAIHGNRSQGQRERALAAFTAGKVQALVATDVAARGIHVDDVACVVHYDLPDDVKDYVHRSGRTGRAGAEGLVVSLVTAEQRKLAGDIQRHMGLPKGFDASDPTVSRATVVAAVTNGTKAGTNGGTNGAGGSNRTTGAGGSKGGAPKRSADRALKGRTVAEDPRHGTRDGARRERTRRPSRPMPTGTVTFFDKQRGFGFIAADNGGDVFVHVSNLEGAGPRHLAPGQQVSFEVGQGRRGDEALKVRTI